MSFLNELRSKRSNLKATETIVTYADGRKYKENEGSQKQLLTEKSCGFVMDTKPDKIPAIILEEGLLLGSQDSVDLLNIENYKITHILSVGIPTPDIGIEKYDKKFQFCRENITIITKYIPCLDLPDTNLDQVIKESNEFISNALSCGGKILVHCNAGVSRSAAVIIGFLILRKGLNFEISYQLVKSKRECIQPNVGFIRQLKNFAIN